ncbi:MAG: DUF4347 domain-containing protein, partial [Halieaceae bacterium]|nr:DUF4347 domain-containing protein [Halieaceae bacterium]
MEPRILLSADALGGAIDADSLGSEKPDPIATGTAERLDALLSSLPKQRENDSQDPTGSELVNLDDLADFVAGDADTRLELVFVDASIENYEELLAGLAADRDGSDFQVHVLDATRDGIEQISAVLAEQTGVDAVHILSHGNDSGLQLGGSWLDSDSLAAHRDNLSGWASALDAEADILFYGCNLAASEQGTALLDSIADLTGADIAASDDLTGTADLGGDWDLEYQAGSIETVVALDAVALQWSGTLPVISDDFETGDYTGGVGWTGDWQEPGDTPPTPHAGPAAGDIQVNDNFSAGDQALQVQGVGDAAVREVDLSGAITATLSFDYARVGLGATEIVHLDIWDGTAWTDSVATFTNADDADWQSFSLDISAYADANTQIRFRSEAMGGVAELFYVDDITIITTTSANDAPMVDLNGAAGGNDYSFTFTEGDAATAIVDAGVVVTDSDDISLASLSLTVTGSVDGSDEQLSIGDLTFALDTADFTNATVSIGGDTYTVAWVQATGVAT